MENNLTAKGEEEKKWGRMIIGANVRFALTLVFLGIFTLANFLIQNNQVNLAKNTISTITFLENQYNLIQDTTLFASLYAQSIDVEERKSLREDVRDNLRKIVLFHAPSASEAPSLSSLSLSVKRQIEQIYVASPFPLNASIEDYFSSIKSFLMKDPIRVSSDNPQLRILQKQSAKLLSFFHAAILEQQGESQKRIATLKNFGIVFFVMSFLCIILIGSLIFLPAAQKIAVSLKELRSVNEALEKIVGERTSALSQKAFELATSNEKLRQQIEDRLRVEKELRRTNAFLDSIIENIPNMIFIKDAEGLRFVRFNKAGEDLLGLRREELLGKSDYELFSKEEADFFTGKDRIVLQKKAPLDIPEESIRTKEKGRRILHTKKIPILTAEGAPSFLLGISEDITEKILAEQKMRALSWAMENALDGIARLDMNLNFLNMNKAYASMLGYTPEELIGRNRMITVCAEDHNKGKAAFEEMLEKGKSEAEIKAVRKDGSTFHQYIVLVKTAQPGQKTEDFYCFAKDISEQKHRELIEVKSELIQMVSHELRTPIHSVKEGISIVLEGLTGELNEEQKEILTISKRCIDRLVRLVNDVLAFHKFEAGVIVFDMKKTDLNALIREVAETMSPLAENKKLSLQLNLQKNIPEVELDRDKTIQVLTNFAQNAIKFTSEGGITITSSLGERGVRVSVKDTGIGIDQKDLSKLFRKFGQLESAKLLAPGGTGLGLAISKKIVELHHGNVDLESELGKGSVFSFTLPLTQPKAS